MSTEERESRAVAESSREASWRGESFIKELFDGHARFDLLERIDMDGPVRPEFERFRADLERVLREHVDPVEIDETGEYPQPVIDALAEIGAFGMKIPEEYGGLGLNHREYVRALELIGGRDANVTALLSAHQAIGVPQPVKLFGTEEQKKQYLPRCAKGEISAFALTEPAVGSDPARLGTTATPTEDGEAYIINGQKLWCTNGTLAKLLVVMARQPDTGKIHAFVVEADSDGVVVDHRCRFMGLRALANAVMSFRDVRVPKENMIGEPGAGLRIALTTLNTGRLSLPAATTGGVKACLEICRKWSNARHQWGVPIAKHEAIAHPLASLALSAYSMETVARALGEMADRKDLDIRLEAAAAKEWNTVRAWRELDSTLQIRGGRGFETERSLEARGELPVGVERMMRDARINLIFEGTSEVMHLFMAREAVDSHLKVAGVLADPDSSFFAVLKALPQIAGHYLKWYPAQWIGWGRRPRRKEYGKLAKHARFVDRASRRLARTLFHAMALHRARLEKKQALLFRAVDVSMELFALATVLVRVRQAKERGDANAKALTRLADTFARQQRREVRRLFAGMRSNDDARIHATGRSIAKGELEFLEAGIIPTGQPVDAFRPPNMDEIRERWASASSETAGLPDESTPATASGREPAHASSS